MIEVRKKKEALIFIDYNKRKLSLVYQLNKTLSLSLFNERKRLGKIDDLESIRLQLFCYCFSYFFAKFSMEKSRNNEVTSRSDGKATSSRRDALYLHGILHWSNKLIRKSGGLPPSLFNGPRSVFPYTKRISIVFFISFIFFLSCLHCPSFLSYKARRFAHNSAIVFQSGKTGLWPRLLLEFRNFAFPEILILPVISKRDQFRETAQLDLHSK